MTTKTHLEWACPYCNAYQTWHIESQPKKVCDLVQCHQCRVPYYVIFNKLKCLGCDGFRSSFKHCLNHQKVFAVRDKCRASFCHFPREA